MPDARTHDTITVLSGAALAPVVYLAQAPAETALLNTGLLVGAHLLSGIMFSPDLDIDSRIDDRWGPLRWVWLPYMRIIPHRHFWSHGLILPPVLRLLYFYAIVMLVLISVTWLLAQVGIILPAYHRQISAALINIARDHPYQTGAFIGGFITGGAAHTIADWLVTKGQRYLRLFGIRITRDYRGHDRWPSYAFRRALRLRRRNPRLRRR